VAGCTAAGAGDEMDSDAHARISQAERAVVIATASAADMLVNFPLWIVAKRASAGVGFPPLNEMYKGATSLYVAMGPMVIVQDASGALMRRPLDRTLDPTTALAVSAAVSGAVGALTVGSQIEGVITRAHATGQTVLGAARSTYASGGLLALAVPHGALAIAGREVPWAGCLFFLSGWVRERLDGLLNSRSSAKQGQAGAGVGGSEAKGNDVVPSHGGGLSMRATGTQMLAAALTACVAGPISHVPSVIGAYQQAHAVGIGEACAAIKRQFGYRGFWGGLLPRTGSLAGSLFVFSFGVEHVQPRVERWSQWRSERSGASGAGAPGAGAGAGGTT
jgi:hypothetical protein